jgi:hypothetical protein
LRENVAQRYLLVPITEAIEPLSAFDHGIQAGTFALILDGFDKIVAEKRAALLDGGIAIPN